MCHFAVGVDERYKTVFTYYIYILNKNFNASSLGHCILQRQ